MREGQDSAASHAAHDASKGAAGDLAGIDLAKLPGTQREPETVLDAPEDGPTIKLESELDARHRIKETRGAVGPSQDVDLSDLDEPEQPEKLRNVA